MHQGQKNQDVHCNSLTHMTTLENLISFSGKLHIMVILSSLEHGLFSYPSGNTKITIYGKLFYA